MKAVAVLDSHQMCSGVFRLPDNPYLIPLVERGANQAPESVGELITSLYFQSETHDIATLFDAFARTFPSDSGLSDDVISALLRLKIESNLEGHSCPVEVARAAGVEGLMCAICGSVLTSLLRSGEWDRDQIAFSGKLEANQQAEKFVYDHVATESHSDALYARYIVAAREQLTQQSFWDHREILFTNLQFGCDVEDQFYSLGPSIVSPAFERFAKLDRMVLDWRRDMGDLPPRYVDMDHESTTSLTKYKASRTYKDRNGNSRVYDWHVRLNSGHRINIALDGNTRSIEVGYVGNHLPTKKY